MLPVEVISSRYRDHLRSQRFAADQGRHDQSRRSSVLLSLRTITGGNRLARRLAT
jgi:hypothetical protein